MYKSKILKEKKLHSASVIKEYLSTAKVEKKVDALYEDFDLKRKKDEANQADNQDLEELKTLASKIKSKNK